MSVVVSWSYLMDCQGHGQLAKRFNRTLIWTEMSRKWTPKWTPLKNIYRNSGL